MNHLTPASINRIACFAMISLLSACGGGGGSSDQAATPAAAVAASPAPVPVTAPASVPSLAAANAVPADLPAPPLSAAPPCPPEVCGAVPYNEITAASVTAANVTAANVTAANVTAVSGSANVPDAQGYLVPSTDVIASGGEAPYPDLRMLPTRIMPFEPIVFGNVSFFTVSSVR
jgi:hypothetical protein